MKKRLFILLITCTPLTHADDFSSYFLLESYSYSEPIAISSVLSNEWDAELHDGDVAFSTDRIELGVGWKQWRLGVFRRYDYYYEFTPDTVLLKYSAENNLDLTPGQQLDIHLSANTLIANGLSLAFAHSINDVGFAIKASYLKGKKLTSGSLTGKADVISENDYDLNFGVDYFYSEDKLFDRVVEAPEGNGYAIDIMIDWRLQNWDFNLDVRDLLAKIYWQDAPRTIATGNTDTKDFDENGFLIFDPVISGIETYQDYTQTLPRRVHFTTAYNWEKYLALFEVQDFEIQRFYSVGAGFKKNSNERINVFYNITAQALKFDYQNQWLVFSITSDEVQLRKARTFALEFSVVVGF